MTKQQRTKQLRSRIFWFFWIVFCIVCWIPFGVKYYGAEKQMPVAGVSAVLIDVIENPEIVEEEIQLVESTEELTEVEEVIDLSVENPLDPKQFKRLGIIKGWGYFTYTYYSERVLPGGGLKIPGRHHNADGFVVDKDGYIVVASDDVAKGVIVLTPYGKGKIYDCGSGHGNLDLYVSW